MIYQVGPPFHSVFDIMLICFFGQGWKLNYLFPQISLATSLKVVLRPYFDKNKQKKLVATLRNVANDALFYPTHAADPQNGPTFRLEQTYSCHIPFEREISAELHFAYQKTPIKALKPAHAS